MRLFTKTDVIAGAALLGVAGFFAWIGRDLPIGRAVRMGPGWVPMALCILLASLGGLLLLRGGLARGDAALSAPWPLRGAAPVIGSLLLFGLSVESVGLFLAASLSVFLAALGAADFKWKEALAVSIGLAVCVSLLFGLGLGLPLKILP
jgi:Tripartite tricarboxylate transporter TctB family